jgi:hypothetical protein
MCFESIAQTFENLEYVKLFKEGVVSCAPRMFCKYDGGITNLTHMFREYGVPFQFRCI